MLKFGLILVLIFSAEGIVYALEEPTVVNQDLVVEKVVSNICCKPTTMAFVGDDMLILEQENGKVRLVRNGMLREEPLLDLNVRGNAEQGLLGITTFGNNVYLYFTESTHDGGEAIANRIYRYFWTGEELINPILIKELPGKQSYHNGGAMVTGLDSTVYAVIGDQGNHGLLQNHEMGGKNDTSVILRIDPPGPYYAMGIRNSFGLAIDPITGNVWDTENGDNDFDEVNFVPPNFNSGWDVIQGPATEEELSRLHGYNGYVYSEPEFTWQLTVVPTAISFVDSKPLEKYKNSVFVGNCSDGKLYRFELNQDRTGFVFNNPVLADNVANAGDSSEEITFGTGFGCITDIEVGPDGFMYILSRSHESIYRIMPQTMMIKTDKEISIKQPFFSIEYVVYAVIVVTSIALVIYLAKIKLKRKVNLS